MARNLLAHWPGLPRLKFWVLQIEWTVCESERGSSGLLVLLAAAAALCMLQSAFVGPSSKPQAAGVNGRY